MKRLHLSRDLSLPLDAVTQTFAILAMRGVGKTHTASVLAEELSEAALPFVVLDPTGAWWGLRSSKDGKAAGYPITILGGDHGDVPLEETGGKLIADLVAEKAPSLILDLTLFSKSAMRRFVADFAERLYQKNRSPLHMIVDEADAFAPQRPRPDEMRMLGALDEIVRRGRIRGLGCTLVTQRSAVLNKDVLTQMEVLVVLRTAHPRDRAPVLEWMKVHATAEQLASVEESLAKMPKGDAWVMSAGWLDLFKRVHIRDRRTFNSSATPTPGQVRAAPRRLAPVDLKELQVRMADTIEKAKASDPTLLRRRIAELEARRAPEAKAERVEVPVIKPADIDRVEKLVAKVDVMRDRMVQAQQAVVTEIGNLCSQMFRISHSPPAVVHHAKSIQVTFRPKPVPQNGDLRLRKGELRILQAMARSRPAMRTRAQLGTLSGFTPSGGTFGTYWGVLKRHGLVEERRDGAAITSVGLELVGSAADAPPQTREEIVETWRRALRSGERAMLDALIAEPRGMTREELGEKTGFTASGGTFGTYLGVLRRNGLAEVGGDRVWASDTLLG